MGLSAGFKKLKFERIKCEVWPLCWNAQIMFLGVVNEQSQMLFAVVGKVNHPWREGFQLNQLQKRDALRGYVVCSRKCRARLVQRLQSKYNLSHEHHNNINHSDHLAEQIQPYMQIILT